MIETIYTIENNPFIHSYRTNADQFYEEKQKEKKESFVLESFFITLC